MWVRSRTHTRSFVIPPHTSMQTLRSVHLISYGITFQKDVPFANTARPNGYEVVMTEHHTHAEQVPFCTTMTPHLLATVMFERGKTRPDYTNDHFFPNKFQADSAVCKHGISSMEDIYKEGYAVSNRQMSKTKGFPRQRPNLFASANKLAKHA